MDDIGDSMLGLHNANPMPTLMYGYANVGARCGVNAPLPMNDTGNNTLRCANPDVNARYGRRLVQLGSHPVRAAWTARPPPWTAPRRRAG